MSKVFGFLYREVRGLHEAAYLLGIFTLTSQVLALLRDRILAHEFGAGVTLDLYYAAFRIPDLLYVLLGSLVSVYVLIPFLSERLLISTEKVRELLSSLYSFFLILIASTSLVVFFLAPQLVPLLFPGFEEALHPDLTLLIRILLLQPIILGVSNLCASVTQVYQKFLLYGVSPILYNIGIIFGVLFLYPLLGIAGLALGVAIGAILHMAIQLPFMISHKLFPSFTLSIEWSVVRKILSMSIPRTLTLSVGQMLSFVFISIASYMTVGSIAVFSFAFNLQSVPLAIIGVSYSVAAFPILSRFISTGDTQSFIHHIGTALRHIVFWAFPATVLLIVLRAQVVRTVLGTGEFDWADTRLVAAGLALFALSLFAHSVMLVIVRAYYAAGNTLKPFLINAVSSIAGLSSATLLLSVFSLHEPFQLFMEALLRVEGLPGTEVLMLPLGYTIGMLFNAMFLLVFFGQDFSPLSGVLARAVLHSGFASLCAGIVAYTGLNLMDDVVDINTFIGIALQGAVAGVLGLIAYVAVLYALKNAEVGEVIGAFHHKLSAKPTQLPDEQME